MIRRRSGVSIFHWALAIFAIVAIAMIAQACSARRDQSQDLGSIEDYQAQSQRGLYAYGYYPYDPFLYGYAPYWYGGPIYYPFRGDGDHHRDEGERSGRPDRDDGIHTPGIRTGATSPEAGSHSMAGAGTPHTVGSGPSGGLGNHGGLGGGGVGGGHFGGGGFGGGHFGGGGFGGGHGGSGHR
jgi:hypothetical protein